MSIKIKQQNKKNKNTLSSDIEATILIGTAKERHGSQKFK